MNPLIPTEEDFTTLDEALSAWEREMVLLLAAGAMMEKFKGIDMTNDEAFTAAFSKPDAHTTQQKTASQTKLIKEKVVLLKAKLIQFRDLVLKNQLTGEISDLMK